MKETYRFLKHQDLYHYELKTLLATVYLQGCLDGAQVQATLQKAALEEARDANALT